MYEIDEKFDRDVAWLSSHYEEIREKYEGKLIAVKNGKVILSADNIEELIRGLEEMNEDPALVLVSGVPSEEISFIL